MNAADRLEQIAGYWEPDPTVFVHLKETDTTLLRNVAALVRACEKETGYFFFPESIITALAKLQEGE